MNLMLDFQNLSMVQMMVHQTNIKSIHQIEFDDYFKHTRNGCCGTSVAGTGSCCSDGTDDASTSGTSVAGTGSCCSDGTDDTSTSTFNGNGGIICDSR